MLKRLFVGLVIGLLVGGAAGFALLQTLPDAMAGGLGYLFAATVGVLVGLVAGQPIWARGAAVEAGLKAVIGAALGCAILFGIRFLSFSVPEVAGIAGGPIGRHAIASLAAIATVLAVFYELDNSGGADAVDKHAPTRKRPGTPPAKATRIAPSAEPGDDLDKIDTDEPAARRRGR